MKRQLRRWLQSCLLPLSAILFVCLIVLQNGFPITNVNLGVLPMEDIADSNNKGLRKLLEKDQLPMEKHNSSEFVRRLPGCIIIGARKCGTRALIEFLKLHPQVVSPNDEVHFFSNDTNYKLGLEWYREKMPPSFPHQITIEKTPKYFISSISSSRIHRMNSSIMLIAILRHPTTRVISDYTQICANKQVKNETAEPFEARALDRQTGHINPDYKATQISMYHLHIARWLQLFPLKQLHVVDGDNLIINPLEEVRKIETFLHLPQLVNPDSIYFNSTRGFYCMRKSKTGPEQCLGVNKGRKHVTISEKVVSRFNKFFRPHNERLYKLIGRRFSWR